MRLAFLDPNHEQMFKEQGWLIFDFAQHDVLEEIYQLAQDVLSKLPEAGFFVTFQSPDTEMRRLVGERLQSLLAPFVLPLLDRYRPVTGNFFVNRKLPEQRSGLGVHLDWSHLDEHRFRSIAAWVPLQDCTESSGFGQIGMLVGSHLGPVVLRGSSAFRVNLPPPDTRLYADMAQKYPSQLLNVRKGQFLLFEHRLAHFSTPNEQSTPRVSAHTVFIPEEAELLHYREEENKEVYAYHVLPVFFTDFVFKEPIPGIKGKRILEPTEIFALTKQR
jgi:hypothetical protein